MRQLDEFQKRLLEFAYNQGPFGPHITRYSMYKDLLDVLRSEDSPEKRVLVIGGSGYLANHIGLHSARKILISYPEFTLENLALSDDSFDFVVSDQVLEHCANVCDAASEAMRVLKPGGWFVHTTCFMNVVHGAPADFWRFTLDALRSMFPRSCEVRVQGWGNRVATILMESGYRMKPVPEGADNPIHEIAIRNEPDWPVTVWAVGRKQEDAPPIPARIATRAATPRHYACDIKPAKFGVVACARNEAPYLLEWIAHYRVLGFEQILIYDNESNDASADILGPLAEAGIISAVYWPAVNGVNKQVSAYNDAIHRLNNFVEWCAFFDLDEFLVLDERETLAGILPIDPDISAIGIPWRIYGSAMQGEREVGLTIERFTLAAAKNNEHVKSIVRLRDADYMNVHIPHLKTGRMVDLHGETIDYESRGQLGRISSGVARLNHYFCRSWEEFLCKRARGRGAVAPGDEDQMRSNSIFRTMDANEVEVPDALRMVPEVREEVDRLRKVIRS